MSRKDLFPRRPVLVLALSGCAAVLAIGAGFVGAQSRIIKPQPSTNSNNSVKRQPVATLRASDSADGSRVALTSSQSLNDYEAYRRGDRFYVKIPPADVPRAVILRGRAFADVKVQRNATSTVVSFRLQPGATARVEQSGNKLNVVFRMPGTTSSPSNSTGRDIARNDAGPIPPSTPNRRSGGNTNSSALPNSNRTTSNRNSADRNSASTRPSPTPTPKPSPSPSPKPSPTPQPSASARTSPVVAQQKSSPSASPTNGAQQTAQGTTWNNFKERARYWILLAQLNPLPVGIGAAVLLLLIGLFVLQRRRAKATRRARPVKGSKKKKADVTTSKAAASTPPADSVASAAAAAAVLATTAATSSSVASEESAPAAEKPDSGRPERTSAVSEEVRKVMAGGNYDESIIAAGDRNTRQMVGAELLSALVGRNLQRRERARAAFMKHGYFDDATRDLRVADSANERAAAARRLSFVHDREATPHLIGALDDSSPDVRRAAVEALMDLRDPAAIGPLNSLMQTETDRKVPRTLIKHAIEACAISSPEAQDETSGRGSLPQPSADAMEPAETEREVIEI